jgi:bacterial/archaeal transporter family-2 protein
MHQPDSVVLARKPYQRSFAMNLVLASLTACFLGAMIAVYQPMNGTVSRIVGSPLLANVIFYTIALVSSFLLLVAFGGTRLSGIRLLGKIREIPPVLWTAGVMSAIMVLGTIILLPRLGARRLFLLQVSGQVIMAILVSHFGLFGSAHDPLTVRKAVGALLLLAGAVVSVI